MLMMRASSAFPGKIKSPEKQGIIIACDLPAFDSSITLVMVIVSSKISG